MNGKFKVWDSEDKKFNCNTSFYIKTNGELWILDVCEYQAGKRFIPIFSTGQTDKNGVENYEGDVLLGITPAKDEYKCVVRFNDCKWECLFENGVSDDLIQRILICEIIGNKFENPELLEQ